jgi:hypothetical protein
MRNQNKGIILRDHNFKNVTFIALKYTMWDLINLSLKEFQNCLFKLFKSKAWEATHQIELKANFMILKIFIKFIEINLNNPLDDKILN